MSKYEAVAESIFRSIHAWARVEFSKLIAPLEKRVDAVQTIKGDRGDAGPAGPEGPQGAPGPAGDRGEIGPQGAPGSPGDPGRAGSEGPQGPQGDAGRDGGVGPQGDRGVDGGVGPQGAAGERGEAGAAGAAGPQGEKGADGLIGRAGDRGGRGDAGPQGERGADGLSAFELAKKSGFVGSEAEWMLSLRGRDGAKGIDGQNGQDGREGRPGERGRDAVSMAGEIHEGIDETRGYAEGTLATLRGGMWIARRATDPVTDGDYRAAGWLCIAEGIADVDEEYEDGGRWITRATILSSGAMMKPKRTKTLMVIDRGLFQSGKEYDAGDMVRYGGSSWIANADTKAPPPGSPDWRLSAKSAKR